MTPTRHQLITPGTQVRFQDPLPNAVDVAVIGGGVIGIASALYLNRAGLKTVVIEKGLVAGEQSSRNWGWIRQLGRDAAELPIAMEASVLWEQLDRETGGQTGFRRAGVLYLSSTQAHLAGQSEWLPAAEGSGLDVRALSASQTNETVNSGAAGKKWAGALWCPSDARAEPWQAVPALAALARSEGVMIREHTAVRALETSAGMLNGVHTENGFVACAQAVIAGGAWTSLFLRRHGVSIPQLSVRSSVARTAVLPEVFAGAALDEGLAFRRREDGAYTLALPDSHDMLVGPDSFRHLAAWMPVAAQSLGHTRFLPWAPSHYPDAWGTPRHWAEDEQSPFECCRVLNPAASTSGVEKMRTRFAAYFPEIGRPQITDMWAGMIDAMPDVVPIVDRVPGIAGLMAACGMSGHGFGIGPAYGKAIANIILERETGHDMSRFRISRFSDGSKLVPGPSL